KGRALDALRGVRYRFKGALEELVPDVAELNAKESNFIKAREGLRQLVAQGTGESLNLLPWWLGGGGAGFLWAHSVPGALKGALVGTGLRAAGALARTTPVRMGAAKALQVGGQIAPATGRAAGALSASGMVMAPPPTDRD